MIDFTVLTEYLVLVVVLACLCVGYVIKHWSILKWIPNDDIPVILSFFGGILNLFVSGFSINSAVFGMFMGLASTGMHQAFKNFIEGKKEV
jgi:Kef-type K+ transport system membrane component KefB